MVAAPVAPVAPVVIPPAIAVHALDWEAVRAAADPGAIRARMHGVVERMERALDGEGGLRLLFDDARAGEHDRALHVREPLDRPLWVIGDLHGDLPALEAALCHIRALCAGEQVGPPRIVFLGDFFDDEGYGLEVLLRVFELIAESPGDVCVIAGNHDEALAFDGARFSSTVSPSDFSDFLNAHLAHEWIVRVGKLAVRLAARAPRALFLPGGLLIAHGGFPLSDLHPKLEAGGDWNDPACLADFAWARAHPKARRKMPNRFSRGSQFGFEDFAAFCALSERLGRPVTHMVRGHDHPEERFAVHPAYQAHPLVTTVALSRRLPREQFGPHARAPTLVRVQQGAAPQVYQLHLPAGLVEAFFPQPVHDDAADAAQTEAGAA